MIQRIQTVYLVSGIVALISAALISGFNVELDPASLIRQGGIVLASALALIAIFLFGRRPMQRQVVLGAQVLALAAIAGTFYGQWATDSLIGLHSVGIPIALVTLLPVLGYALFWLARRAIDKDIALVRSMDRLR